MILNRAAVWLNARKRGRGVRGGGLPRLLAAKSFSEPDSSPYGSSTSTLVLQEYTSRRTAAAFNTCVPLQLLLILSMRHSRGHLPSRRCPALAAGRDSRGRGATPCHAFGLTQRSEPHSLNSRGYSQSFQRVHAESTDGSEKDTCSVCGQLATKVCQGCFAVSCCYKEH